MVDYPYATDFVGALPANPVKTACTWAQGNFTTISSNTDYVKMLQIMLNVFQNYTGTLPCMDVGDSVIEKKKSPGGLDDNGWSF